MISTELEVSLQLAAVEARQQDHEEITVEHMLLALLDNPSAAKVLKACHADIESMRRDLITFMQKQLRSVRHASETITTRPTPSLQRVIARTIMSVGIRETDPDATGADMLLSIASQREYSFAMMCVQMHLTRPMLQATMRELSLP